MRNLVGLFFRMEEVKKETGVEALGAGAVKPRKIWRVGVLGAGVMGGGIAQLAADKGLPVADEGHQARGARRSGTRRPRGSGRRSSRSAG